MNIEPIFPQSRKGVVLQDKTVYIATCWFHIVVMSTPAFQAESRVSIPTYLSYPHAENVTCRTRKVTP